MKIACPGCGAILEITPEFKGHKLQCVECEQKFLLPDTDEELLELEVAEEEEEEEEEEEAEEAEEKASTFQISKRSATKTRTRRGIAREEFSWAAHGMLSVVIGVGAAVFVLMVMYVLMVMAR